MVRATNTGVTAAIDERGRVVGRLPAFVRGSLEASPVPRSGSTPYVKGGNAAALALAALAIGLAAIRRRRR
jgi:apolipoprotein N-acyltransferase